MKATLLIMLLAFIIAIALIALVLYTMSSENFVARRLPQKWQSFISRIRPSLLPQFQSLPVRRQSHPVFVPPKPQLRPQQGLPLGPAIANPYGTGIVQGSSLAPLQMQYRSIYTPRPSNMMSGQQQMQQHLAPSGLGHTGWYYRTTP